MILLPDIDFYSENFINEEGEWTPEAAQFASKFTKEIVKISKNIQSTGDATPAPTWTENVKFKLDKEKLINIELIKVEEDLHQIQLKKEILLDKIKESSALRNLLFEKGKLLEHAIHLALNIIGFEVSYFDDGKSEFDAVFTSEEGRFIGEAEGRDNKPINIDKLRQIALNIHEDLRKEDVVEPAKGVLFGNPYRMLPIDERNEPFTEKCLHSAIVSSTALIFTPDLFIVAKYLHDNQNKVFAKHCRNAILKKSGRVLFPEITKSNSLIFTEAKEE